MKQSITIKEIPNALDILTEARILALADAQVLPALTDSCGDVQRNGEGLPLFHPIAEEIVRAQRQLLLCIDDNYICARPGRSPKLTLLC